MSLVTDIVLVLALSDVLNVKHVNEFFRKSRLDDFFPLQRVDKKAGGDKVMQAIVLLGAYNYFNLEDFKDHLRTIEWYSPEDVRLFVGCEETPVDLTPLGEFKRKP
jgi:hypothetical protein